MRLTLLVGSYAQAHYLPETRKLSLTERVRQGPVESEALGLTVPLPHPSWRVRMWIAKHPWFESDVLPQLRAAVAEALE